MRTLTVVAAAAVVIAWAAVVQSAAGDDPLAVAVERYANEDENYSQRIKEYLAAQAEDKALTAEEKRRYSNAYVYYGYLLYRHDKAMDAAQRFREAIVVDEGNPLAHYCLALLHKKFISLQTFQPAVEGLRTAAKLDPLLKDSCREQLVEIINTAKDKAEAAIKEKKENDAARWYLLLIRNFDGKTKADALEKLAVVEEAADPLVVTVERYAEEDPTYGQRIQEHQAAHAQGASLTAEQKRRYSNAYVYYGYVLYLRNDQNGAAQRFREAITVDKTNPLPLFCLGRLQLKYFGVNKEGVAYLRAAKELGGALTPSCQKQLDAIVAWLREQAEASIKRGSYIGAEPYYRFLAANFEGEVKADAQKKLKAAEDEIKAEKILREAKYLLKRGRDIEGKKKLDELITTYAWTRAGEEAKKIRRGGKIDEKPDVESPAGEYAARERWIDLETANCIVYYKSTEYAKLVAKRVEETLKQVTEQLQYTKLDWHKDKCKVFVFDDAEAWAEFKSKSGAGSEWAAGFAYPTLREIYMDSSDLEYMIDNILPHELTHVIHREYVRDDTLLPLWLLEGLAVHNEFAKKEEKHDMVRAALASGHLIPLNRLTAFTSYPGGGSTALFYAESLVLVEFILDRFGNTGLANIHKKLRKAEEFEKVVKRALKLKIEEFEAQWHEYIRTKQ